MGGLDRFVNRKDVKTPNNLFENFNSTSNDALIERQRLANDLRVKVPVTRLGVKSESNQRRPFDDTDFEESTISSIDGIPREQMAVVSQHLEHQYGQVDDGEEGHLDLKREDDVQFRADQVVQDGLVEEAKEARKHILNQPEHFRAQSPPFPRFYPDPAPVRSTSPIALNNQPPSRPRSSQKITMPPPPPPPSKPKTKSTVILPTINTTYKNGTFDKTSSYTDSSVDRSPSPPPPADPLDNRNRKKRPISELFDYDAGVLKQMSFSDLDSQPFDVDPRRPPSTATNNKSTEDSHLATLRTLKSLASPERTRFFSSQTKDQWVASTIFFESRLKELVKELVTARDRRRDVAVRFEDEVRERMKVVKGSGEGIERCLGEIRGRARGVLPGSGRG